MSNDTLARIVADKKKHIVTCKKLIPLQEMEARASTAPPVRSFYNAIVAKQKTGQTALIAEIKKASPSAGLIRTRFNPTEIAKIYDKSGATCLSVLTDTPYFQGSNDHLKAVRAISPRPILRKDFLVDPYQIVESRAIGADCILLILACLTDEEARNFMQIAQTYDMSILIETHDQGEMERAVALSANASNTLIGINNRNLKTLQVDLGVTEHLSHLAKNHILVSESGIKTAADIARLKRTGISCFLVGETLLKQADIGAATRDLLQ
jgi:indole-3-glycerol phosphate synthase